MAQSYLLQFLEKAHSCKTIEQLQKVFDDVLTQMGISNSAVMANYGKDDYLNTDCMDQAWITDYMNEGIMEVDPFITRSNELYAPVTWKQLSEWSLTGDESRGLNLARDHNLKGGIFVPLMYQTEHKSFISIMSDSTGDVDEVFNLYREQLISIGYAFHSIAQPLLSERSSEERKDLFTEREKECLQWSAKGKSAWEVANIINISERTVIFHLNNAKKKIGATSKAHLITKAVAGGYVDI